MKTLWIFFICLNLAFAKWRYPDKEYAIVPVEENEFFDDVNCTDESDKDFQKGLYYDGTPCEMVSTILSEMNQNEHK